MPSGIPEGGLPARPTSRLRRSLRWGLETIQVPALSRQAFSICPLWRTSSPRSQTKNAPLSGSTCFVSRRGWEMNHNSSILIVNLFYLPVTSCHVFRNLKERMHLLVDAKILMAEQLANHLVRSTLKVLFLRLPQVGE